MHAALPTTRQFRVRLALTGTLLAIPAVSLMLFALWIMLELSSSEMSAFGIAAAIYGSCALACSVWRRVRVQRPVERFLDDQDSGELRPEELRAALQAVVWLPRHLQQDMLLIWVAAGFSIPLLMMLIGQSGWGLGFRSAVMVLVCTTGGLVSSALVYFVVKKLLVAVCVAAADRVPDPEERRALVKPFPLARKVQLVVAGSTVAALIFTMSLTYGRAGAAIEDAARQWQQRVLSVLEPRVAEGGLSEALEAVIPESTILPYAAEFALYGEETERGSAILAAAEQGASSCRIDGRLHAWIVLPDGRLLVSTISRDVLWQPLLPLRLLLGAVLLLVIGLSMGVSYLLADDISGSVRALHSEAERIASGDLREVRIRESDDELGELARSFGRMAAALRATVGRVTEAADRVDSAATQFARVSEAVGAASADQVARIQQTGELTVQISAGVSEVAQAAQDLNLSVEESSSSILELGAAGDELNDTASVLSTKVDEVSSSIEEMVRSVSQVGSSSDGLADAAAETSSSMEEMASAMRAVDTTAEKTADLSRDVVRISDKGQSKVAQTMEGMRAIRDATDAAEQVIRGLGVRTEEIGAILDVIDDVADETNLLALNAAIIAAQAGEHGRAFSVVADEIKELADRVLASTKEIGGLIHAVQEESANAVGAVEDGSRRVASGVDLSAEAGTSLEEITGAARESGDRIGEIVSAVREQTKAAAHVVALMDRVREGVDQIASAGAQQDRGNEVVYRSVVTMREVAQQVRRTTEEQSRGFGRIRESIEGVHQSVEKINGSLQEQSSACENVSGFLGEITEGALSNERAAHSMQESMRALVQEAEALREDVAKFRI